VAHAEPATLYAHTLDSLCVELVSGRAVPLDGGGSYRLPSPQARSLFEWYRQNPAKWAKNTAREDVEALADRLDLPPPVLDPTGGPVTDQGRTLHLRSLRTHRFGGIQRYGNPGEVGIDFFFEFERPLTLIEGSNGAGKTSLLSAITWALTGYVYRSQAPPERLSRPVSVQKAAVADDPAPSPSCLVAPITSLPPADVVDACDDKPLPPDTWVEVSFADDDNHEAGSARRSVSRVARAGIVVTEPNFAALGLDPLVLEVGTRMPGLLPHVRLGVASDLGKAVAALLGLKPLQDLAAHAARSQVRLRRELVKDRQKEIEQLDAAFSRASQGLACLVGDHPALAPPPDLPLPASTPANGDEALLTALARHFEGLQAEMLAGARALLGESFNYQDRAARQDLIDSIGPAVGLVDAAHMRNLPSAARLAALTRMTEQQLSAAEALLQRLAREAHALAALADQPAVGSRLRLYARVAGWLKEAPTGRDLAACPVCAAPLGGKKDPVTGKPVVEHLRTCLETEGEYLEKGLQTWEEGALTTLRGGLPETLVAEAERDLPGKPADLIAAALGEELFSSRFLQGSLAALRPATEALCSRVLARLPQFEEPAPPSLPASFADPGRGISQALRRVGRAVAFARWRQRYERECREAFGRIVGRGEVSDTTAPAGDLPLSGRLAALDRLVKNAAPLAEALAGVASLNSVLADRRVRENRIFLYQRTADALEGLTGLKELVERQVASLMGVLADATARWQETLYAPAFAEAPAVSNPEVAADGSLAFDAGMGGTRIAAQHIGNESALRATLLAFLFAFWEYLHQRRGGLSLMLLDDVQELFDRANRERIATGVAALVARGARVIITTNDAEFARGVAAAAVREVGADSLDHRRIEPPTAARPHLLLVKQEATAGV
jgi:hypothetical protein